MGGAALIDLATLAFPGYQYFRRFKLLICKCDLCFENFHHVQYIKKGLPSLCLVSSHQLFIKSRFSTTASVGDQALYKLPQSHPLKSFYILMRRKYFEQINSSDSITQTPGKVFLVPESASRNTIPARQSAPPSVLFPF